MVGPIYSNSEIGAHIRKDLFTERTYMFSLPFYLHTCATCPELPNISTMELPDYDGVAEKGQYRLRI